MTATTQLQISGITYTCNPQIEATDLITFTEDGINKYYDIEQTIIKGDTVTGFIINGIILSGNKVQMKGRFAASYKPDPSDFATGVLADTRKHIIKDALKTLHDVDVFNEDWSVKAEYQV